MAFTRIKGNKQIADGTIENLQISATAAIETTKLAEGSLFIKSNGSVPFTAVQVGVDPVLPSHLATKGYVDGVAQGLDVKQSVRVTTTANIALSGTQTVDDVVLVAGDRVLVKNQTVASENGIYVVAAGAWARSADADNSPAGEVTPGMFTFVEEGTVNSNSGWALSTIGTITLDTTDLAFAQFSGAGSFTSGGGLVQTGNVIDIISANGGIVVNPDSIALTLADASLEITPAGLKLADLTQGNILVGNAQNKATSVAVTGDISIDDTGATSINLTSGKMFIGDVANKAQAVTISGEITIDSTGVASFTKTVFTSDRYVNRETPAGVMDGVNAQFTLANAPVLGTEMIFWNGMLLDEGAGNDYTISGAVITLLFAPSAGEKLRVSYFK